MIFEIDQKPKPVICNNAAETPPIPTAPAVSLHQNLSPHLFGKLLFSSG